METRLKLTEDERDELFSLFDSQGWLVLLKILNNECLDIDKKVLVYNLSEGPSELVILKARSEGARLLQNRVLAFKDGLRKRDK